MEHIAIEVPIIIASICLWVAAITSAARTQISFTVRVVWLVVIVVFPVLGSIAWFWAGRPAVRPTRTNR